uniref:HECT-type E3 ubiquitin transferase n=1 Tax=Syphacia muris TaxID=451379 RepID=A0A0N5AXS7_9BILA
MANNIYLYDFNGSIRKNKKQEAIFKDLAQKDEFLKRVLNERTERQLMLKSGFFLAVIRIDFLKMNNSKNAAAVKIQAAFRSYNVRQKLFTFLRSNFDSVGRSTRLEVLEHQISRLHFFFNKTQDRDRTIALCSDVIACPAYKSLNWRRRRQLISCALSVLPRVPPDINYIPLLRYLECSVDNAYFNSEASCTLYYNAILSLFSNQFSLPKPISLVSLLPPRANSILQFLELPLKCTDTNSSIKVILMFPEYSIPRKPFIIAIIAKKLGNADKESLTDAFGRFVKSILELRSEEHEYCNASSSERRFSVALENESIGSFEYFINYISTTLAGVVLRTVVVDAALDSDMSCSLLVPIIDFLLAYNDYFNNLSTYRNLVTRLWRYILQMKDHSVNRPERSLLTVFENIGGIKFGLFTCLLSYGKNEYISPDEEVILISALSLFSNFFTKLLETTDDDDFVNGGQHSSSFPFNISEVSTIASHFRYQVANLTRMLYERDCRLHFMPLDYWSSHNRHLVIMSCIEKKQHRSHGRFGFVRFLIRRRNVDYDEELQSDREASEGDDDDIPLEKESRNLLIVLSIPFVLRFLQRAEIFTELIAKDKERPGHDFYPREAYYVTVHRGSIYEDAFTALSPVKAPDLRNVLRIQMVSRSGINEAGIDGGGIFREFMSELLQQIADPAKGFFTATGDQMLYPNPLAMSLYPDFHDHFYFIGRIIAKLIYEGLLADLKFADFFILQWFNSSDIRVLDLEYMKSYDPLVYENLKYLKHCSAHEVDALELDFSVLTESLGVAEKINLKKDGDLIRVTAENRAEYIALYVHYFLSKRISPMLNALRAGFRSVINLEWLSMFSPLEISMLIGGADAEIDFTELKKFTTIHNIHDEQYIELFWSALNTFSSSEKRKFLKFVTGCPRPPLMGFEALNPPMGVQLLHQEVDRLPTAGTCMNLLKLPVYPDYETLKAKLCVAIDAEAGFDLS